MSRIKVVTDSSAHFRPGVADRLDIVIVPQDVHLDGVTYQEGVDVTSKEFLQKMAAVTEMPTVSPPSVATMAELYRQLHRQADEIISLHVSSQLSRTCENARVAAQPLLGRCDIVVIDSLSASLGLGMLVETAAEAAASGVSLDEVVRLIRGTIPHVYMIFLVDALEYLEREKRIRPSQAVLGAMLGIKPLLTLEDGRLLPMEKVRTRALGVEKLLDFISEFVEIEQLAILQSSFSEDTALLLEGLELLYPDWDIPVFTYTPSLAVHLGTEALGVAIYERV
ncbi:MAG: DegV family protein [Chloroflexi bacterium]|nr:DegV family protein [Chloroflexota bacterium]